MFPLGYYDSDTNFFVKVNQKIMVQEFERAACSVVLIRVSSKMILCVTSLILFTDEIKFSQNDIITSHNFYLWLEENPHVTVVTCHLHQFEPINV